jgi:hypothetical protein
MIVHFILTMAVFRWRLYCTVNRAFRLTYKEKTTQKIFKCVQERLKHSTHFRELKIRKIVFSLSWRQVNCMDLQMWKVASCAAGLSRICARDMRASHTNAMCISRVWCPLMLLLATFLSEGDNAKISDAYRCSWFKSNVGVNLGNWKLQHWKLDMFLLWDTRRLLKSDKLAKRGLPKASWKSMRPKKPLNGITFLIAILDVN